MIYGANAMWFACNVHTEKWGIVCFRPTAFGLHPHEGWYFYISPNGTPWAATYAIGNLENSDKDCAPFRKFAFGHNFDTDKHGEGLHALNQQFRNKHLAGAA